MLRILALKEIDMKVETRLLDQTVLVQIQDKLMISANFQASWFHLKVDCALYWNHLNQVWPRHPYVTANGTPAKSCQSLGSVPNSCLKFGVQFLLWKLNCKDKYTTSQCPI